MFIKNNEDLSNYYFDTLNKIENNKEKIIDAFSIYYGEKYRNIIEEKLKNISYTAIFNKKTINEYNFILCDFFEYLCGKYSKKLNLKKNKIIFNMKYFKRKKGYIKFFNKSRMHQKYILEKIIEINDNNINLLLKKEKLISNILDDIDSYRENIKRNIDIFLSYNKKTPRLFSEDFDMYYKNKSIRTRSHTNLEDYNIAKIGTEYINNKEHFFIIFRLFCIDDCTFIHELNHAITTSILANEQIDNDEYVIIKMGLKTEENEMALEEILNEKSAFEINNIFHNLGGNIFDDGLTKYTSEFDSYYMNFFDVIDNFYKAYRDVIKETRITTNKNLLFKYINKDIYNSFFKFINEIFYENETKRYENKKRDKNIADNYVKKMRKQTEKDITLEDLEKLKLKGLKLRILKQKKIDTDNDRVLIYKN